MIEEKKNKEREDQEAKRKEKEIAELQKRNQIKNAFKLGRSIAPLESQGRKYKSKKFEIGSVEVAKDYFAHFKVTRIEIPTSNIA